MAYKVLISFFHCEIISSKVVIFRQIHSIFVVYPNTKKTNFLDDFHQFYRVSKWCVQAEIGLAYRYSLIMDLAFFMPSSIPCDVFSLKFGKDLLWRRKLILVERKCWNYSFFFCFFFDKEDINHSRKCRTPLKKSQKNQ